MKAQANMKAKAMSQEAEELLDALNGAEHLYCSGFPEKCDYFGAFHPETQPDGKKGEYTPVNTTREVIEELCQLGYLESMEEPMPTLAGTVDQRWSLTELGRALTVGRAQIAKKKKSSR